MSERVKLFNSPLILKPAIEEGQDLLNDTDEQDQEQVQGQKPETRSRSQSPLKFRERLSHFFGYKPKFEDTEHEDEDVLRLKQLIEEQESAEVESFKSDLSENKESLFDEETYLNTMRNTHIIAIPEEPADSLSNIPMSRLFLNIFPEEEQTMQREKDIIVGNGDYPLLKAWSLWNDFKSENVQLVSKILTKIQLNETILGYKRSFKHYWSDLQIHIFQNNIAPKRSSEELAKGGVIAFQTAYTRSYKLWKDLMRLILDDCSFNNLEQNIKGGIVGLSFILKPVTVLVKIWIERYRNLEQVHDLCEFLMNNLGKPQSDLIYESKLILNKDLRTVSVFDD